MQIDFIMAIKLKKMGKFQILAFVIIILASCRELSPQPTNKLDFVGTFLFSEESESYIDTLIINENGTYYHSISNMSNEILLNECSGWYELESDHFMLEGFSYLDRKTKGRDMRPYRVADKVFIGVPLFDGREYYYKISSAQLDGKCK